MKAINKLENEIIEFIVCTKGLEEGKATIDDLFSATDKMYAIAEKRAKSMLEEGDFKEAAKGYLLISQALENSLKQPVFQRDSSLHEIVSEKVIMWRNRAKQIIGNARNYYLEQAEYYDERGEYAKSTTLVNIGKKIEVTMESDVFIKEFKQEVEKTLWPIEVKAYAELGRKTTAGLIGKLSRALKRKAEGPPIEQRPGIEKESDKPEYEPGELALKPDEIFEKITIKNNYRPRDRKGWYDWWIYLSTDENIMKEIESVTYNLHPTFPNPVRTKKNRSEGFKLVTSGWGEFRIKVDIHLKNNITFSKYYWLDLGSKQT
jgi:hypothetical protein